MPETTPNRDKWLHRAKKLSIANNILAVLVLLLASTMIYLYLQFSVR